MLTPDSTFIVYQHVSPSGKSYVGITHHENPNERWRDGNGYGDSTIFGKAIKKYGWDSFEHKILYTGLTKDEACLKEQELIKDLNLTDTQFGYNSQTGGTYFNYSADIRRKISINTSKALKGKPKSEKAKEATRRALLGNPNVRHPNKAKGKTIDELYSKEKAADYRRKMVENRKSYDVSAETRIKTSLQNKGRKFYTNGVKDIMLKETDKIPDGFYKGRTFSRWKKKEV